MLGYDENTSLLLLCSTVLVLAPLFNLQRRFVIVLVEKMRRVRGAVMKDSISILRVRHC